MKMNMNNHLSISQADMSTVIKELKNTQKIPLKPYERNL